MKTYRRPHRIKKKKSIFKNKFFRLAILLLIISIGFFYLVCFSSLFQIKEIKISGNQKVLTKNLQKITQQQVEKKLVFFPTKSIFLANLNAIDKILLKKFPPIAKIKSRRKFPDKLIFFITEREPIAVFKQNGNQFLIDKQGIIYEKIAKVKPLQLTIQNKILKRKPKLGEKVLSKENLSQILKIESKLNKDLKILLNKASIISKQRLNAKVSEGWEIYFNLNQKLDWQLTKLSLVLREKIPSNKHQDLEYIDLRFGNRAYYKYKKIR